MCGILICSRLLLDGSAVVPLNGAERAGDPVLCVAVGHEGRPDVQVTS